MDTLNNNSFNSGTNDTLTGSGSYSPGSSYSSGGSSSGGFDISTTRGGSKNALGLSITSLCLGIAPIFFVIGALVVAELMVVSGVILSMATICGIAGLILGVLAIRRSYGGVAKALSITGIIVSGIAIFISVIFTTMYIFALIGMLL